LADVKAGKIDVIVVYKVDRLTRSLADFAKLVELFDGHDVSFVSVTQQFNTTTSMGRLTLNVLLRLPSSSGKSHPSAFATRSRPPSARVCGSGASRHWDTRPRTAKSLWLKTRPSGSGPSSGGIWSLAASTA
jgi:Resolvase, N terminal domain